MRVVNTSRFEGFEGFEGFSTAKVTRAPSERPTQLRCMVRTFSGQAPSSFMSSTSSSAYWVILQNHCSSSRISTIESQRQQRPSMTCSLASTVLQLGHQLTLERLRYARPRSSIFRKIHWFHL